MTEGVKQAFLMEREFQSQAEISSKSRVDGYDDFILVEGVSLRTQKGMAQS